MGQPGSTTFDSHWKSMENWDKTFSLFVAAIFSKSTEEMDRSVGLSKHISHYDPQSGFAYYNLTTLPLRERPLSTTYGHAEQLCGLEPWEPSPVPSHCILKWWFNFFISIFRCRQGGGRKWRWTWRAI
jgi:hypothetical protein